MVWVIPHDKTPPNPHNAKYFVDPNSQEYSWAAEAADIVRPLGVDCVVSFSVEAAWTLHGLGKSWFILRMFILNNVSRWKPANAMAAFVDGAADVVRRHLPNFYLLTLYAFFLVYWTFQRASCGRLRHIVKGFNELICTLYIYFKFISTIQQIMRFIYTTAVLRHFIQ